jgi:hypothetical protein
MMDSRILYKTSEHLFHKVEWIRHDNNEWLYCGLSNDFNDGLVNTHLKEHFSDNSLYFILTRAGCYEFDLNDALLEIKGHINDHTFSIWNTSFTKVMQFNLIGVFRKGSCAANISLAKGRR